MMKIGYIVAIVFVAVSNAVMLSGSLVENDDLETAATHHHHLLHKMINIGINKQVGLEGGSYGGIQPTPVIVQPVKTIYVEKEVPVQSSGPCTKCQSSHGYPSYGGISSSTSFGVNTQFNKDYVVSSGHYGDHGSASAIHKEVQIEKNFGLGQGGESHHESGFNTGHFGGPKTTIPKEIQISGDGDLHYGSQGGFTAGSSVGGGHTEINVESHHGGSFSSGASFESNGGVHKNILVQKEITGGVGFHHGGSFSTGASSSSNGDIHKEILVQKGTNEGNQHGGSFSSGSSFGSSGGVLGGVHKEIVIQKEINGGINQQSGSGYHQNGGAGFHHESSATFGIGTGLVGGILNKALSGGGGLTIEKSFSINKSIS